MEHRKRFQPKKSKKKLLLFVAAGVVAIAAVIAVLELTNTTYMFHKRPPRVTASQNTKGETSSSSNSAASDAKSNDSAANTNGTSSSTSTTNDQKATTTDNTAVLLVPTGDFVSNHHPSLSGGPTAPNQISSVCTTTPGASCVISFTKDGVTKSLLAETADSGGSAYWDWKLQDIKLTAGSWKITATATLNGQTKSATDALELEVSN